MDPATGAMDTFSAASIDGVGCVPDVREWFETKLMLRSSVEAPASKWTDFCPVIGSNHMPKMTDDGRVVMRYIEPSDMPPGSVVTAVLQIPCFYYTPIPTYGVSLFAEMVVAYVPPEKFRGSGGGVRTTMLANGESTLAGTSVDGDTGGSGQGGEAVDRGDGEAENRGDEGGRRGEHAGHEEVDGEAEGGEEGEKSGGGGGGVGTGDVEDTHNEGGEGEDDNTSLPGSSPSALSEEADGRGRRPWAESSWEVVEAPPFASKQQ
jgi:hypothetical protein